MNPAGSTTSCADGAPVRAIQFYRFYLSLEDDLMRLFGSDNISGIMDKLGMDEDEPIEHKLVTRSIENAQKKVESRNFDIRKHVLEYDDVMNEQREVIYDQRRKILEKADLKETVLSMADHIVDRTMDMYAPKEAYSEDWDIPALIKYAEEFYAPVKQAEGRRTGQHEPGGTGRIPT